MDFRNSKLNKPGNDLIEMAQVLLAHAEQLGKTTEFLKTYLTCAERAALGSAILQSLMPDQILAVIEYILPQGVGQPIAPLFNQMDEAAFWADMAEPEALEAYFLASYDAMSAERQAAILKFLQGRWVA